MAERKAGEGAIGNEAVLKATNKDWPQWFEILDDWDATNRSHKETAAYIREVHDIDFWWAQTVTVRYEQERGLRILGEKADGTFEVSVSRTIEASAENLYDAFTNDQILPKWFGEYAKTDVREGGRYDMSGGDVGHYRRLVRPKRIRMTWDNEKAFPGTLVEIRFTAKTPEKTSVTIQHMKLPSGGAREMMKVGWSWALDSLKSYFETGERILFDDWQAAQD